MRVLRRRLRIFLLVFVSLTACSKLLYLKGLLPPNVELVLPATVSFACLFPIHRHSLFLPLLLPVFLIDLLFWGPHRIYLFTWSGFFLCWILTKRYRCPFERLGRAMGKTLLASVQSILLFDFWTGIVGWSILTGSLLSSVVGQLPFTMYHLLSVGFVPPLVLLAKLLLRIPIPVMVTIRTARGARVCGRM